MNEEEQIANKYLQEQGFKSIKFEPNGPKTPPDFESENHIAVEVRRLNKHVSSANGSKPIEDLEYNLIPKFKNHLKSMDNPSLDYTIGIVLTYKRPISVTKKLLSELGDLIVKNSDLENYKTDVHFNEKISFSLWKQDARTTQTFELRGQNDKDKGRIVQDARYEALKVAVGEKSEKLESIKNNYKELYLILIDDIFSRVDKSSVGLSRYPKIESIFDRIILISKRNPQDWVTIFPWVD